MPTKVRIFVDATRADDNDSSSDLDETTMTPDKSKKEDPNDESQLLDTSVNMLLDDTIDSESESELVDSSDEEQSDNRKAALKPTPIITSRDDFPKRERNPSRSKNELNEAKSATIEESQKKSMCLHASVGEGAVSQRRRTPCQMGDIEASFSDSDSSLEPPPGRRNNESTIGAPDMSPGAPEKNETRLSDVDSSFGSSPPRRHNRSERHTSGKVDAGMSPNGIGNDETRLSDSDPWIGSLLQQQNNQSEDHEIRKVEGGMSPYSSGNDETRLSISFQEPPCEMKPSRPHEMQVRVDLNKSNQKEEHSRCSNNVREQRQRPKTKFKWRQQEECEDFRFKFREIVSDFKHNNPRVHLRDYVNMSTEEQVKEQQKVINLLDRIGIRRKAPSECESTSDGIDPDATIDQDKSTTRLDSPINASRSNQSKMPRNIQVLSGKKEDSLGSPKLSPIAKESPQSLSVNSAGGFSQGSPASGQHESPMFMSEDSATEMSVEITRGADDNQLFSPPVYQSPPLRSSHVSNAKRLATTSGKRGQDCSRVRLNLSSSLNDSGCESMPNPGPSWHSSDDSISFESAHVCDDNPFAASQSPIAGQDFRQDSLHPSPQIHRQRQSYQDDYSYEKCSSKSDASPDSGKCEDRTDEKSTRDHEYSSSRRRRDTDCKRSTRRERQPVQRHDDTIDTVNATAFHGPHGRTRLRDTTNIGLKEGVPFHYNPLLIKGSKRRSQKERSRREQPLHHAVDFRDPLGENGSQSELYQVFEWMVKRDFFASQHGRKWSTNSKGIIFSLEEEQIVNVTIKFLIDRETQSQDRRERYSDTPSLTGETLIVVRSKDDVGLWERAFREHTPFSVISHAALASGERKRTATASKCATYDVVISTYDALKSQDTTVQLDEDGHAVVGQGIESQSVGGWMTKRSTSSTGSSQRLVGFSQPIESAVRCKQLSALHRVQWKRILFIDDLGRKCYLAKSGTARVVAAAAVNSEARYVFFTKEKEESDRSAFEGLLKSDRRAIPSVASVLRIETDNEDGEDEDLLDVILDPRQGI